MLDEMELQQFCTSVGEALGHQLYNKMGEKMARQEAYIKNVQREAEEATVKTKAENAALQQRSADLKTSVAVSERESATLRTQIEELRLERDELTPIVARLHDDIRKVQQNFQQILS